MATFAEALALTFLPSTCATCRTALPWAGSRAGICAGCWGRVVAHRSPLCPVCGDPETASGDECLACRSDRPPWRGAASVGPYQGVLRDLVLLFKAGGRDELARPLGELLASRCRLQEWGQPDAVVAVPMTWTRRLRRGYDQADLLGRAVAHELGAHFARALSRRGRGAQVGRSRAERLRLSARAFSPRRRVSGRVLLVDDVFTTGATAAACARSLSHAGADEVYVLTIARTPQSGRIA
ncbi:MAG TPA: ComF family protein [Thermoanaerobaculaceae bacterium]|nr:ComF family protein [Thermoanaerobaculaceae bacterium]